MVAPKCFAILIAFQFLWSQPMGRQVGRAACGLIAGLVLGLLMEPLFFWPDDPDINPKHYILDFGRVRLPLIGPAAACAICGLLAAVAGRLEIQGVAKHLIVGVLVGVVLVGVVVGGFIYPAIATPLMDTTVPTKYYAGYRLRGMTNGIPVGALLGLVIGMGYYFFSRSKATDEPSRPLQK